MILTDCPREYANGVPLPKLEVCSLGLDDLRLGDSREQVIKRWKIQKPATTPDGGLLVFQPSTKPYDLAVVYFENGKAVRILARHRAAPTSGAESFAADLGRLWAADVDRLGVVRRIDKALHSDTREPTIRGYSWNDDQTRVHIFVEPTRDGWRTFTEWRAWPFAAPKVVAVKK